MCSTCDCNLYRDCSRYIAITPDIKGPVAIIFHSEGLLQTEVPSNLVQTSTQLVLACTLVICLRETTLSIKNISLFLLDRNNYMRALCNTFGQKEVDFLGSASVKTVEGSVVFESQMLLAFYLRQNVRRKRNNKSIEHSE